MTAAEVSATAERQPPDANCHTLPNGECVSDKDCMHGPATAAPRWAVVDVSNDTVPESLRRERVTMTFRTWIGAQWMRWRWVRRHKREHCWPGCSTLWHYEVRRAR